MTREYETPGHLAARSRPDDQEPHPRWPGKNESQPDSRARPGQALEPQPAQEDRRPARPRRHDRNKGRPRARDRRPAPRRGAVGRCRRRRTEADDRTLGRRRGLSGFLSVLPVGPEAGVLDRLGPVADPPSPEVVVTTGLNDGVVTETVATGVVALTVAVGTDGATLGTVVDTAGTVAGTVVGTVGTTVDTTLETVDTTLDTGGTVVGTVDTVTVALSGRAVASTFATKKPDTAKQTSTTRVLHFTIFISPSAETACTQKQLVRSRNLLPACSRPSVLRPGHHCHPGGRRGDAPRPRESTCSES